MQVFLQALGCREHLQDAQAFLVVDVVKATRALEPLPDEALIGLAERALSDTARGLGEGVDAGEGTSSGNSRSQSWRSRFRLGGGRYPCCRKFSQAASSAAASTLPSCSSASRSIW